MQLGLAAGGDGLVEGDGGGLRVVIVADLGRGCNRGRAVGDLARVDINFHGVEGDGGGVLVDMQTED